MQPWALLSGVLRGNVIVTHCGENTVEEVAGPRFSVQRKNKALEKQSHVSDLSR